MIKSSDETKTPLISIYNEKPDLRKKEPPLINLQVTNPVTYIKKWWKSILGNEGIDFHFKIKPLTAIALTAVIMSFGFGLGRLTISTSQPYIQYSSPTPTPTSNPWRETAFSGILKYSKLNSRFYLLTATSEAINLEVPKNIDLNKLTDKRIFATGTYNENNRTLVVTETQDLEILPIQVTPIPTSVPQTTPIPSETPSNTDTP